MLPIFRNFKTPEVLFSRGGVEQLPELLDKHGCQGDRVYIIDHCFEDRRLEPRLGIGSKDRVYYLDTTHEPKTETINDYKDDLKALGLIPAVVIGVGGGSAMDAAKALSIILTNPGKTEDYQGWDLVKEKPIFKVGIPTISGTGAEVSRTTVLTGPVKKQGINSIHSMFDQVILDPELLDGVPKDQRFYTAMDCYIHSVEALCGRFINAFSRAYAEKALVLCRDVFLGESGDDELMIASMFGGYSIVYSEVGVCHAMSYGLAIAYGLHHGVGNCVAFNHLKDYYPEHYDEFQAMVSRHGIDLPEKVVSSPDEETLERMIQATLLMERPLHNALGENWRKQLTPAVIKDLYLRM
jgi:3-deoxy-alpha-D-manno-octulosonate 8-oxidase